MSSGESKRRLEHGLREADAADQPAVVALEPCPRPIGVFSRIRNCPVWANPSVTAAVSGS